MARDLDQLGEEVDAVEVGMMAALVVWSMSVVVVTMAGWMAMSWIRCAVVPVSVVFLVVVVVVVVV